jgi:hypothetical protein
VLYYSAALPHNLGEIHHQLCSEDRCVADNTDVQHYESKHTTMECDCDFVGPNSHAITTLIQEGHVPLIRFADALEGDQNVRLEVVKAEYGVKYIAISHVWSGDSGTPYQIRCLCVN